MQKAEYNYVLRWTEIIKCEGLLILMSIALEKIIDTQRLKTFPLFCFKSLNGPFRTTAVQAEAWLMCKMLNGKRFAGLKK